MDYSNSQKRPGSASLAGCKTAAPRGVILALMLMAVAGCSNSAPTAEQLLARANEAFTAGQYVNAEKQYREVLRQAREEPTALKQLAIIYYEQGQLLQAFPLLKRAAELLPNDADVQLKLARALLLLSFEPASAREAVLRALEQRPGDEHALILLADTAVSPQDVLETESLVQDLRQKDQDRAGYHLALGTLGLRRQDQTRAESEFKAAIKLNPKSSEAYLALGMLYWRRNDLQSAGEMLKVATDLSPPRSPNHLLFVEFKVKSGAVAEARALLEDINRQVPDALPPRVALMKIACAEKREDCAMRVKDILSQDPTNVDAVRQNGILNLDRGEAAQAIRDFEYLSKIFPRNAQIRHQLALAYLLSAKGASEANSRNAIQTAESNLSEAIRLDPLLEQAILLFAELKISQGSPAATIDPLARLIKERPKIVQAHYLLGTAYMAQRNGEQALALYQTMTQLFPQEAQPFFFIGTIQLARRQPSLARQAFEKAIELDPDYLSPLEMLVDLDIAEKQYAAGLDRIQKRIDKDQNRAPLWALRGKLQLAQGNLSLAETDLLKAIELDGNLTQAYVLLAQLYVLSKRQEEAVKKLKASIEIKKTVPALLMLTAIHEQGKDFSAARDAYEALLSVSNNFVPAINNLAVIYAEHLGQLDKAVDLARRARELNPSDPNVADTLGWILFRRGEFSQALQLLNESVAKQSSNPEVQFHLGMAHYMMGDERRAHDALRIAVESKVDFPGKVEARARLALLAIDAANDTGRAELGNYLSRQPNDPIALAKLAQLQERDRQVDLAITTYEKIVTNYPQFAPAIRRLALLYSERPADFSKAFEFATRARQAYPDDSDIAKALGLLNFRRELYPRAVELLRQAAASRPDDAELFYYLGDAHRRLKQWPECKAALELAVKSKLASQLADQARLAHEECLGAL